MIDKNRVLEFIKKQSLCVLSTVTPDNKSESAVMAYSVMDDLTLIMNTEPTTRKFENIVNNPNVSIIVGGLENPSLQIEAMATIAQGGREEELKGFALQQHPELKDYLSETGRFVEIKPYWVRWSNFDQNPVEIEEMDLR